MALRVPVVFDPLGHRQAEGAANIAGDGIVLWQLVPDVNVSDRLVRVVEAVLFPARLALERLIRFLLPFQNTTAVLLQHRQTDRVAHAFIAALLRDAEAEWPTVERNWIGEFLCRSPSDCSRNGIQ